MTAGRWPSCHAPLRMAGVSVAGSAFPSYYGLTGGIPASTSGEAANCSGTLYGSLSTAAAGRQGSLLPTGSANSFAYPFVDSGMPSYITAATGCGGYKIYPDAPDPSGWGGGFTASDIAGFH